ncbi:MAG: hypothetical protein AAGB04_06740 [Pseudomonadota bacterium]
MRGHAALVKMQQLMVDKLGVKAGSNALYSDISGLTPDLGAGSAVEDDEVVTETGKQPGSVARPIAIYMRNK